MAEPAAHPGHARRLVFEQAAQLVLVASGFFDRLILTGFILRIWGVGTFEIWAACIAFAALVSLFELGFNIYFYNQLTIEMERGEHDAFRRTLATGNTIFICMSLLGLACAIAVIWTADPIGSGGQREAMLAVTVLCVAASARLAMCPLNALYRANRQYARFALISAIAEIARISIILGLVISGFGLLVVAIGAALSTIVILFLFVIVDTRRRFTPHRYVLGWPEREELMRILSKSFLYFGQLVPVVLWTSLPILFLQNLGLASGMLASFVLIRTLANVARTPMQSLAIIYGQECGRRIAIEDQAGALRVARSGARLFAVVSGLLTGLLVGSGMQITTLWTGKPELYDQWLMAAAVLPMVLVTATLLVTNVLMCAQAPARPALARWVQMGITILAYVLLTGLEPPMRMMLALAIGEIFGYAPIAYHAMARLIPGTGLQFHLVNCAIVLASILLGGVTIEAVQYVIGTSDVQAIILGLVLTCATFAFYILAFAIGRDDRRLLWAQVVAPAIRRIRSDRSGAG